MSVQLKPDYLCKKILQIYWLNIFIILCVDDDEGFKCLTRLACLCVKTHVFCLYTFYSIGDICEDTSFLISDATSTKVFNTCWIISISLHSNLSILISLGHVILLATTKKQIIIEYFCFKININKILIPVLFNVLIIHNHNYK